MEIFFFSLLKHLAQVRCFNKWKDSNCIISKLINNVSTTRKGTWDKESKILNDKLNNISSFSKKIMEFIWDRDINNDKMIKAKTYKMNNFENSRNYLKPNLEFPEYIKGFRWILRRARCGYKIDARVAKAAKMNNNSCPNCCSCCFHCDNSLFNSLVVTSDNFSVDNRINNIVKGYKSSDKIRINSISNIDILGNRKIVNRYRIYIFLIGGREHGFNKINNNCSYKKEWECLFKCQTESVVCKKKQHILFNKKFKTNLSRNVNADNSVGQPSKANADPISDPSGIG
ncbi:hypothetical protein BCR32DRAFT_287845 [Anaeromyces robustus]|uniref:Uncharacterized protein n=1 Tax=Anaeromyces robustus TaxID=1754192 RepID=A0A1Y1VQK3_9FUNG|nr:hypothetical protein BCR32DRAFT_287845 [Anaeromyces robustus]|eukprot:ORX63325.1 hypothetical protein BCR32DRAFT_287845 [Anaeromyces robustus]